MPWKAEANPRKLVESARSQIEALVKQEGITQPSEIAPKIWGDVVNFKSRSYNGKEGVK